MMLQVLGGGEFTLRLVPHQKVASLYYTHLQRNGASYTVPSVAPLDYPINLPAAAPVREAAWADKLAKHKAWNTYIIVHTITRNQFAAAINDVYYAELNDPTKGLKAISLCDLFTHICSTYAMISQPNVDDNMAKLSPALNLPSHLLSTQANRRSVRHLPKTPEFRSPKQQWYHQHEGRPQLWQH
jgi:hypothetical protein